MAMISQNVMLLGNGYYNFYIAGQEKAALIECGTRSGAQVFAEQWAQLQNKPNIEYIVVLHSHFDHSCGIPILTQLFPNAKIVGSALSKKILSKEKIVADLFSSDEVAAENYLQQGIIKSKPVAAAPATMPVDIVVGEGDTLDLGGGISLKFLDAPGHSICSIAAYVEKDQVMLVSDATGYRLSDGSIAPVYFAGYSHYTGTIRKLMSYPTAITGPAHGNLVKDGDVGAYYQQSLDESQQSFDYIKDKLAQGVEEKALARELFARYVKDGLTFYPVSMMSGSMHLLINSVKAEIQ